ncbi:FCD domain-containing protein, partial [Paracoccus sp. PXZ]
RAGALRAIPDWRGVGSANMEFHAAIVALTDSPRLIQFFTQIIAELRLAFGLLDSPELLHRPYISRNAEILGRLEAGDPAGAARMLEDYLTQSERAVLEAFARLG